MAQAWDEGTYRALRQRKEISRQVPDCRALLLVKYPVPSTVRCAILSTYPVRGTKTKYAGT